jgi:o-succinylbenzoate synthase
VSGSLSIDCQRINGTLQRRTSNARASWSERAGLLVTLTTRDGCAGQGEASPLPHYSSDSLEACSFELRRTDLIKRAESALFEARERDPKDVCEALFQHVAQWVPDRLPAARFALETALLDYESTRRGVASRQLLVAALSRRDGTDAPIDTRAHTTDQVLPLAFLLDAEDPDRIEALAEDHFATGARIFKLKVGRPEAWAEELRVLRLLRRRFPACRLRLDANGQLADDPEQLAARLTSLEGLDIEFIEEPVSRAVAFLPTSSPIAIALDEALQRATPDDLSNFHRLGVRHFVFKPMAIGLGTCLTLMRRALDLRSDCVVSHLFGGPIELTCLAHLALGIAEHQGTSLAAGLAPHAGLSIWPPVDLPLHQRGELRPTDRPGLGLPSLKRELDARASSP